jgi:hypothetical protein
VRIMRGSRIRGGMGGLKTRWMGAWRNVVQVREQGARSCREGRVLLNHQHGWAWEVTEGNWRNRKTLYNHMLISIPVLHMNMRPM